MYMFLPFLIALCAAVSTFMGKTGASYALWLVLLLVTLGWFDHHVTDPLTLSF